MGTCGCGDYGASLRLPGPDGVVYAIAFYRGCNYCDAPPGVIVHRHSTKDAALWGVNSLPEPDWHVFSADSAEAAFPAVDFKTLKALLTEQIKLEDECDESLRHEQTDEGRHHLVSLMFSEMGLVNVLKLWWPGMASRGSGRAGDRCGHRGTVRGAGGCLWAAGGAGDGQQRRGEDGEVNIVYARRHRVSRNGPWFRLHVAHGDDVKDMHRRIAFELADGMPDEECFDLGVGTLDAPPPEDQEPFDVVYADSGFGEVRVSFEEHGVEYTFGG